MPKVSRIFAREILDSRSNPTVETVVLLDDGSFGIGSVPSGSSTGSNEALELRDQDDSRFLGQGVLKAIGHVNQDLAPAFLGKSFSHIKEVDDIMLALDPTPNKNKLGANSILSVSIAFSKALASSAKIPLYRFIAQEANNPKPLVIPKPVFNMINGGKHGAGNLEFQEFHVIPSKMATFSQMLETGVEIYQTIKNILIRRGAVHSVGDEGGFAPNLFTNLDALEIMVEAITACHHQPTLDVELGLDIASNSFFKDGKYSIKDRSSPMDVGEFIDYLRDLNSQYHLRLLEDPLDETDWKNWVRLTSELGANTTIVGDDLLVTNFSKVQKAIQEKACTGIIIKPNQVGTVSESLSVVAQAQSAGWKINVSHRSGETTDTFIADFAVGVGADYAKFGAPARGERVVKYNRLLIIESELLSAQ